MERPTGPGEGENRGWPVGCGGLIMLVHMQGMRHWSWASLPSLCGPPHIGGAAVILYMSLFAAQLLTFWLMVIFAVSGWRASPGR
jgi:uncharacterized membrane protein HdeD (DUF308 family)